MTQRIKRALGCVEVYWGNDPHQRMQDEQTPQKVRKGLEDQLRTNGRPVFAWLPVVGASAGTVPCTCEKDTTNNSDFKCMTCFGTKYAPGYIKFLHSQVYFCSAEFAGYAGPYPAAQPAFTLSNVVIDRTKKPNRLMLASGATSGTIVTPDKPYTNPGDDVWELELSAYRKTTGDTFALEYSLDAGVTYRSITLTPGPLYGFRGALTDSHRPLGSGTIRFRVTMTRVSGTSPESPSFEIVRVRHVRSLDCNPIIQLRNDYTDGQILILKTWDQEFVAREIARGRTVEAMGDRAWTAPLDFFDLSLTRDTPPVAFDDREAGPHPLFEYTEGIRTSERYAMYAINLDATLDNVMSHQSFSERRIQAGELYSLIF